MPEDLKIPAHRPFPFLLSRTSYLVQRVLHANLKVSSVELTPEEVHLLMFAIPNDGILMSDFSKAVQRDRTTASRLLDSLEKRGMIARVSDEKDRRAKRLSVTAEGRATAMRLVPIGMGLESKLVRGVSEQDLLITISVLTRMQSSCLDELRQLGFEDEEPLFPSEMD